MSSKSISTSYQAGGIAEFFTIAYPLIISNASVSIMHFVDRLFLAWSSPEEIAACLPAGILHFTMIAFFLGICEYTNTFVAHFYGANRWEEASKSTWQGIWFAICCGLFCILLIPFGNWIFEHIGHPPDIIMHEKIYFSVLLYGGVFFLLKESLSSFYSGRGKTKVIMIVNIIANLVNGFLDYALIFGNWGFPRLGIQGAAIATVCATAFICVCFFILFLHPMHAKDFKTRLTWRLDLNLLKRLLRFGAPSGAHFLLEIGCFTVFLFLIGQIGKLELAASNIVLSLNSLAWFPMIGAGVATTILVGQYMGRRDLKTAEKSAYSAFLAIEIYLLIFAFIYFMFPAQLMELFQGETGETDVPYEEVKRVGIRILLLIAFYQVGDGMIITFSSALRGAGDTFFAMWANILFGWCFFVPGAWLMIHVFDQGVIGAWVWASFYIVGLGTFMLWRFRSGYWKTIQIIHPEPEIPLAPIIPQDTPTTPETRLS